MATRYRATVVYDGTAYQGFQRQAGDTPTIQLALEQAIAAVTRQQVTVIAAGRTDTGVHANGQVIAFDVEWSHGEGDLLRAMNAVLPDDIALQDIAQQVGFHPRFDAISRLYQYYIVHAPQRQPLLRYRAWHLYGSLDYALLDQGAALLVGQHDFATFGQPPYGENTVRTMLQSGWTRCSQPYGVLLVYHVEADAFLQHMVRRIVGWLVDLGRGAVTLEQFGEAFRRADPGQGGMLAPPHGLVLEAVRYHQQGEDAHQKQGAGMRRPLEEDCDE